MARKLTDANRLSLRNPEVAAEWHPTKNGGLTSHDVTYASNIRRWWRCEMGHDHEWEESPGRRTSGRGCPFCAGKRVADSNRLSENYPELVPEWHPTKNGELTPDNITAGSNRKVWWRCDMGEDHDWEDSPNHRTSGRRCPFCAGRRVADSNRLSTNYPDLVPEWHPTKNGDLTPDAITVVSGRKVWWRCQEGHDWKAVVANRTRIGSGCPYCAGKRVTDSNRLSIQYPDVAREWHSIKNGGLTPDDIHYSSNKKFWWLCTQDPDHEWEDSPNHRTSGRGCPFCAGRRVADSNRLSTNHPELVLEWHPTENGELTPDEVTVGSNRKVWWRCQEGHDWKATIVSRTAGGHGCPYCSGLRVSDANRLSIHFPDVVREWHPDRNSDLSPSDVGVFSNRKVWWQCERGHEWEAVIPSRTLNRSGCPYCAGKRVSDVNRLSIKSPELIDEWHPTKNGDLTPDDVSYGTAHKVWWTCERGHEWKAAIHSRSNGSSCPSCSLSHRSKVEIYLACELATFFGDIDPDRTHSITTPEGVSMDVDIMIPSQNLVIEYDGSYWHKDKLNTDVRKTEMLQSAGWDVLRIREYPLERVQSR